MRKFYLAIPFAAICLSLASVPSISLSKAAENDAETSSSSDWRNDDLTGGFVDEDGLVEENAPYLSIDYLHVELGKPALVEIYGVPGNRWVDVERNSAYINVEKVDDNRQIYEISLNYNDYNGQSGQHAHESGQIEFTFDDVTLSLPFDLELGYYQDGLFDFQLNAEGTGYTLTGVNELPENIVKVAIPAYYQELPVTEIGSWAFEGFSAETVVVPSTVKSIGVSAFESAEMNGVFLTEGLERIGDRAFYQASIEEELSLPRSLVYIGDDAFRYLACPHLYFASDEDSAALRFGTIDFSSSAITYSTYRFGIGFYRLEEDFTFSLIAVNSLISGSLFVPRSVRSYPVKRIGDGVNPIYVSAEGSTAYTVFNLVEISEGVEEIAPYAFYGLHDPWKFPSSIKKVGDYAFASDPKKVGSGRGEVLQFTGELAEVGSYAFSHSNYYVGFSQAEPGEGWAIDWDETELDPYSNSYAYGPKIVFGFSHNLNNIIDGISYAVAEKDGEAYAIALSGSYPDKLKATVQDGETAIPVKAIAPYAFVGWTGDELVIPEGIETIGYRAFADCDFNFLRLPSTLKSIDDEAFSPNNNPQDLYHDEHINIIFVPDSVNEVGDKAFEGKRVYYAGSTKPAGWSAELLTIDFRYSSQYIKQDGYSFLADGNKDAVLLKGPNEGVIDLTSAFPDYRFSAIGPKAFYGSSITSFDGGDRLAYIYESAFHNCASLLKFVFPSNLIYIGESAFFGSGLTSINIVSDNLWLGDMCFGSSQLKEATLKSPTGGMRIGDSLFYGAALEKATILVPNLALPTHTFCECRELDSVILDDSTASIGERAFSSCQSLTDFALPASVTYIGQRAFENTPVDFNDLSGIEYIGDRAFQYALDGSSITIPLSAIAETEAFAYSYVQEVTVTGEGDYLGGAFRGCYNLKKVTLPSTIKHIDGSFDHAKLEEFTCPDSLETIDGAAFRSTNISSFQAGPSLRTIGDDCFRESSYLDYADLSGVTTLGDRAFLSAKKECLFYLSADLEEVGEEAFNSQSTIYCATIYCAFSEEEADAIFPAGYQEWNVSFHFNASHEQFNEAVANKMASSAI